MVIERNSDGSYSAFTRFMDIRLVAEAATMGEVIRTLVYMVNKRYREMEDRNRDES